MAEKNFVDGIQDRCPDIAIDDPCRQKGGEDCSVDQLFRFSFVQGKSLFPWR